jgi:hypothetical protein
MAFCNADSRLRNQPALEDHSSSPPSTLTGFDEVTPEVSRDLSLAEAGPLDHHDIGVEGGAAEGHLTAGHDLSEVSIDSGHFDLLSVALLAK